MKLLFIFTLAILCATYISKFYHNIAQIVMDLISNSKFLDLNISHRNSGRLRGPDF